MSEDFEFYKIFVNSNSSGRITTDEHEQAVMSAKGNISWEEFNDKKWFVKMSEVSEFYKIVKRSNDTGGIVQIEAIDECK